MCAYVRGLGGLAEWMMRKKNRKALNTLTIKGNQTYRDSDVIKNHDTTNTRKLKIQDGEENRNSAQQ